MMNRIHWIAPLLFAICILNLQTSPAQDKPDKKADHTTKAAQLELMKITAGEFGKGAVDADTFAKHAGDAPGGMLMKMFVEVPPLVKTKIAKDYYIGRYEVTIGQFREFVKATGYKTEAESDGMGGTGRIRPATFDSGFGQLPAFNWQNYGFRVSDEFPVSNVTRKDAKAFCDWLGKAGKRVVRLPTEAEWEYACRAGTTGAFYFEGGIDELTKHANVADASLLKDMAGFQGSHQGDDGEVYISKVGRYKPNPWGLHDMYGNVGEWCEDPYSLTLSQDKRIIALAGKLIADGPNPYAFRGGHWFGRENSVSSAARPGTPAGKSTCMVGFRVVMEK